MQVDSKIFPIFYAGEVKKEEIKKRQNLSVMDYLLKQFPPKLVYNIKPIFKNIILEILQFDTYTEKGSCGFSS